MGFIERLGKMQGGQPGGKMGESGLNQFFPMLNQSAAMQQSTIGDIAKAEAIDRFLDLKDIKGKTILNKKQVFAFQQLSLMHGPFMDKYIIHPDYLKYKRVFSKWIDELQILYINLDGRSREQYVEVIAGPKEKEEKRILQRVKEGFGLK